MTGAAIYWNPEAYDTSGPGIMGRHAAGEGFIRGYVRHGAAERLALWNVANQDPKTLEPLLQRIQPTDKPIDWIARSDFSGLARLGVAYRPSPSFGRHAWARQTTGDPRAFSLCGVTHTTVLPDVLNSLNDLALAPVQPWDALICTSRAVVASLRVQAEMLDDYLKDRLGATKAPRPQYVHIPLGVNMSDFETSSKERRRWRKELDIGDDDIVVLYVGRFNITSKMNPIPMAIALEKAAALSDKRVHWVMAGWAEGANLANFEKSIRDQCLNVAVHFVDGRKPENRFSIWSVADIFLSLSDNIQETFGLTPVEAMAAGLPSVISDWDGYKDLLRHGVDGFRIPTYTPSAGLGRDLAFTHSQEWTSYDGYVGSISQFTAVDMGETIRSLAALMGDPDLRVRMGASAKAHAQSVFDWKVIIPRYEALWAELNARRRAAPPPPLKNRNAEGNPWRPDPFRMFASYPTEWLTATSMLAPAEGMTWDAAKLLLASPVVTMAPDLLPRPPELEKILALLEERRQCTVAEVLDEMDAPRRPHLERGLVWMAKYGMIAIRGRSNLIPSR